MRSNAAALFRAGKYAEAARAFRHGYEESIQQGDVRSALRCLNSSGACWLAALQYCDAARALLAARRLAESRRDWEMAGVVSLNLTSVYLQMGELSSALEETRRALGALDRVPGTPYRAQALVQSAKLKSRTGDPAGAIAGLLHAIWEADRSGDPALRAQASNQLGFEYLNLGRLPEAERAMLEAFRLRALERSREIGQSYRAMGLLRLAQGDLDGADALMERAIEFYRRDPGRIPSWAVYHGRGELRLAQHRLGDAVADFRTALELARAWRLEVLPSDSMRTSAEVELDQLYSSFIRAASELYFETGRRALASEAFAAAGESRALSLRAALGRGSKWRDRVPAAYGGTLSELRTMRAALLRTGSGADRERVGRLRNQLAEMEMRAGLEAGPEEQLEEAPQLVQGIARRLGAPEALLSFHLDEPHSYAWVITRESFETIRLAGAGEIRRAAGAFVEAVERGSEERTEGERLYGLLFAGSARIAEAKHQWLLAVDDLLYGAPFAALPAGKNRAGESVYLVERHSVTILPGGMGSRLEPAETRGPFVAVGDPVYNAADKRSGGGIGSSPLQLPRLAGSSREIRACAGAWSASAAPVLLEGKNATRRALASALAGGPGVIHLATHVVRSAENPARRLIPLSLLPGGDPEYVGPEDIAAFRLPRPALVVISGCASGVPERRVPEYSRQAAPPFGLVGLARAWLSAGARSVAVTLWPTPDDNGELFRSFYRYLSAADEPSDALALARAQIDMLHSGTWRAVPRHWAAYLIVGKR